MSEIIIYQNTENQTHVEVQFEGDTLWLTQDQIGQLFDRDRTVISKHLRKIFKEGELNEQVVSANFAHTTQHGAVKGKTQQQQVKHYNLDAILSVGYRVNSKQGTHFRQWANRILREYLIDGYSLNEKRLQQKKQEVEFLKTGLRIVSRALENVSKKKEHKVFLQFAKGLSLLDDYDHETLDQKGVTQKETIYPNYEDYIQLIGQMYSNYESAIFAKPKDEGFHSSINQIRQSFDNSELYPSIEEKAANLLYYITKNHSFVDGNKRIAAACFLYFLQQNNVLYKSNGDEIINNDTLATLTLFIANSRTDENEVVKRLIISVLNRNK